MLRKKSWLFFGLSALALGGMMHVASFQSAAQDKVGGAPTVDPTNPPLESSSSFGGSIGVGSADDVVADEPARGAGAEPLAPPKGANPLQPGKLGVGGAQKPAGGFGPAAAPAATPAPALGAMGGGMSMGMMPGGMAPIDPADQLEQQAQSLIFTYSNLGDDQPEEKGNISQQLLEVTAQQFDLRQQAREDELKALEEQVRKLRELHNKRTAQKDKIIKDRVQQLLRDADGLGWGADNALLNRPGGKGMSGMMGSGMGMPAMQQRSMVPPGSAPGSGGFPGGGRGKDGSTPTKKR